jgi:O-antigen ligase
VRGAATQLATLAISGGALLVLLLFVPALEAPFLVPKFAALELAAALGVVAYGLARTAGEGAWARPITLGALLVVASTTVAWIAAASKPLGAPYALAAMARWGSLLGVACGASVLADSHDARQRALEAVTVAAAVVALIGLLQHIEAMPLRIPIISTPGSTFGNRNIAAEVMAIALPLGLGATAGARGSAARAAMLVALGLELLFLGATRARGAWLGACCGLGTGLLLVRPRWSRTSLAVAVAVGVAVVIAASKPGSYNPRDAGDRKRYAAVVQVVEESFDSRSTALRTRVGLWRRSLAMVREQPLVGVGPGNWPVVFPRYAEPGARRDGVLSAALAPRQAHNDLVERAAETGLLGLVALGVLAAGSVIAARRRLQSHDPDMRASAAGAAGALVALVSVAMVGFPLEMPGTLALSGLALGLIAPESPPRRPDHGDGPLSAESLSSFAASTRTRALSWATVALGVTLFAWAAMRAESNVRASAWLERAERALRREPGVVGAAEALGELNFALAAEPRNYRAQFRAAQMLLRERRFDESAQAARRALDLEPYAPNAWAVLSEAELDAGQPQLARGDASRALALLHDYPFAIHLRALAAERQGDAPAAQADRLRLQVLAAGPEDDDTTRSARALIEPAK